MQRGQVVKLDRGYPLVRTGRGVVRALRARHRAGERRGSACRDRRLGRGDRSPEGHDKGIIESILPRTRAFVRKDPTERALPQVLAANFDRVFVAQPLSDVNVRRLERELVLAYETGAAVTVVLTKADLAESEDAEVRVGARSRARVGRPRRARRVVVSADDPASVEAVRALVPPDTTAVLIGKSGVGKSSLVNLLVGHELQETADVRERDGKGRHTTVSREMVAIPGGGLRRGHAGRAGTGPLGGRRGHRAQRSPISRRLAEQLPLPRLQPRGRAGMRRARRRRVGRSERSSATHRTRRLRQETNQTCSARREEARRMRGEKASDRRKTPPKKAAGRARER